MPTNSNEITNYFVDGTRSLNDMYLTATSGIGELLYEHVTKLTITNNSASKKLTFGEVRFGISNANGQGINSIIMHKRDTNQVKICEIKFPNTNSTAQQITDDSLVGTVDGVNKKFRTSFNKIKNGTLSVYNTVVLVSADDYTAIYDQIDNRNQICAGWELVDLVDSINTAGSHMTAGGNFACQNGIDNIKIFKIDDLTRLYGVGSITFSNIDAYAVCKLELKRFNSEIWESYTVASSSSQSRTNATINVPAITWTDVEYVSLICSTSSTGTRLFTITSFQPVTALPDYLIEFDTAPVVDDVLTASYQTNCIPKSADYVVDVTFELLLGEGI